MILEMAFDRDIGEWRRKNRELGIKDNAVTPHRPKLLQWLDHIIGMGNDGLK